MRTVTDGLASLALIHIIASIVYIVGTRDIGTPFMDSLTEEQRVLKRESAKKRGGIFSFGVLVGVALVVAVRTWRLSVAPLHL